MAYIESTYPIILTSGGGTINLSVEDPYSEYDITGTATLAASYVIQASGSPVNNTKFVLNYNASITLNSNTLTIFGVSLTDQEALKSCVIISKYNGSSWVTKLIPNFNETQILETQLYKDDSVSNDKLSTMSDSTIKGNISGATANPSDISISTFVNENVWGLSGNSGTNPSTNFIGTTDNQALVFKVNSVYHGALSAIPGETSLGYNAISYSGRSGDYNTGVGHEALRDIDTGYNNVGIGHNALTETTGGYQNTAVGKASLMYTNGNSNTAIGDRSGISVLTGSRNTMVGAETNSSSNSGVNRIALGYDAEATADYQFAIPNNVTHINFALNSHDAGALLTSDGTGLGTWNTPSINTTAGDSATINKISGRFKKDTSGTTFTLTNSFITADSIILLTAANSAIDGTATSWTVNAGSGSATITFNAAPTSNFDMNFLIIN